MLDGAPRLNWTKVGLKEIADGAVTTDKLGLNWTKVGLKDVRPSHRLSPPEQFELD